MIQEFGFELTGTMPLLMHQDKVEWADELDAWRKTNRGKDSKAGDDRSPAWTWFGYCYEDDDGRVAMPADNLMVAIRSAAAQVIWKRQKTFKELSQSGLMIMDEFCEFTYGNGKELLKAEFPDREESFMAHSKWAEKSGFRLFVKRAKVGRTKHIRVRPRFDDWQVRGRIQILTPEISKENLTEFLEGAGRQGLCDWRPGGNTPGPFGQFSAKLVK